MADKQKKLAQRSIKKIEAYKKVFLSADGTLVLHDLMAAHGMLTPTYNGNVNDMLLKEGERNVVLRIMKFLGVNPEDLQQRIEEYERELAQ